MLRACQRLLRPRDGHLPSAWLSCQAVLASSNAPALASAQRLAQRLQSTGTAGGGPSGEGDSREPSAASQLTHTDVSFVDPALALEEWGKAMEAGDGRLACSAARAGRGASLAHTPRVSSSAGDWDRAWDVFEGSFPVDTDDFPALEEMIALDPEAEDKDARRRREIHLQARDTPTHSMHWPLVVTDRCGPPTAPDPAAGGGGGKPRSQDRLPGPRPGNWQAQDQHRTCLDQGGAPAQRVAAHRPGAGRQGCPRLLAGGGRKGPRHTTPHARAAAAHCPPETMRHGRPGPLAVPCPRCRRRRRPTAACHPNRCSRRARA